MNYLRIKGAAIDCLSRFKASKFPLKNIVDDIINLRKLNSKERKILYDLVFKWMRNYFLLDKFLKKELSGYLSLSANNKDKIMLDMLSNEQYVKWRELDVENPFLESLGPLIKDELMPYGAHEANIIAESLFDAPKQYLAFDNRFLSLEDLIGEINKLSFTTFLSPLIPSAVGIFEGGFAVNKLPKAWHKHVWVMDAGSQFIANIIKPKTHEKILDMCTGLGGKLKYISIHEADYYACDINKTRLDNAKKWVNNSKIKYFSINASNSSFPKEYFDWVLLDAPCSGTGTIKRHPDIIYRLSKNDLNSLILTQKNLLDEGLRVLKVNGKLVYATCSVLFSENEDQIKKLLLRHKNISIISKISLNPRTFLCDGFFVTILNKDY